MAQNENDLQAYNLFMYCSNNPLKYSDPTGHYYEYPVYTPSLDDMFNTTNLVNQQYNTAMTYGGMINDFGNRAAFYGNNSISAMTMGGETYGINLNIGAPPAAYQSIHSNYARSIQADPSAGTVDYGPQILTSQGLISGMMSAVHTGLDVVGLVPALGEIADLGNAVLYAYEGDYWNAGLSAAAIVPIGGWAATAGKYTKKAIIETSEGGLNLFKFGSKEATTSAGWKSGDYFLNLPDQGTPTLNWKQNYGALRSEMNLGNPIYDSYRLPNGELIQTGGFLGSERYILQSRGWNYSPINGAWMPPY